MTPILKLKITVADFHISLKKITKFKKSIHFIKMNQQFVTKSDRMSITFRVNEYILF